MSCPGNCVVIKLKDGQSFRCSPQDVALARAPGWRVCKLGYITNSRKQGTKGRWFARIVLDLEQGQRDAEGRKLMIDHIDRDPKHNCRGNLRLCTPQQNAWNRPGTSANGYKGVADTKRKLSRPFQARIIVNRMTQSLGYFSTAVEAARAYNEAAKARYGPFAYLNPIPD